MQAQDTERFWSKVERDDGEGCWLWTAGTAQGYGRFRLGARMVYAHRVAYELLVGPIPDGLQIDHLCCTRRCVRPDHLEPVTQRENIMRGTGLTAVHARKTHCVHGHEFTAENTYRATTGERVCRECKRAWLRAYRAAA